MLSCCSGIEIEVSLYIHPPFKVATSRSNGLGMKNVVELSVSDVSWSSRVFAAVSLSLNEILESSPVPTTIEYFLYFSLHFSVDDYGRWVIFCFASCNRVIQSQSELHYVEY